MSKRLDAARKGETKYQGAVCKRGHDGWRYTKTGGCIECSLAANKVYAANVSKLLAEAKK